MVRDLRYEDVKHVEGKLHCTNLDLLAAICGMASEIYCQEKNSSMNNKRKSPSSEIYCQETNSSMNNKRKSPSSCLEFLESEIPRKKRSSLREPRTEKENPNSTSSSDSLATSEPETRKEWVLEKLIPTGKDNKQCSTALKFKFKLNGDSVIISQNMASASSAASKPLKNQENETLDFAKNTLKNNQEKGTTISGSEILANRPPRVDVNQGPSLAGLPESFQKKVVELGRGRQVYSCILVLQKKLFMSDIDSIQHRLLIPKTQMREFLDEHEKRSLPVDVEIIEPYYHVRTDTVKLANSNKNLVLRGTWGKIVERNGLKVNTNVQLWAVRYVDGQLIFVLVDVTATIGEGCSSLVASSGFKASEKK